MIVYISDFDLNGSGYMNIGTRLCNELATTHGKEVMALGYTYDGREHDWPYTIVPVAHLSHIPEMVKLLLNYEVKIDALVVALDILLQENLMDQLNVPNKYFPYIGLFPLESPPLCQPWAIQLLRMKSRLIMSKFGQEALADAGIDSTFIPFGVHSPEIWRPPAPDERKQIRQGLGIDEDDFVILTVADNQERKNLSRTAEIISGFSVDIENRTKSGIVTASKSKRKTKWYLVTRPDSPVGWKLDDLGTKLGIFDRMAIFNRGIPNKNLWALYAAADCFLLTSKADGLAIPVLEAMACRLPVAATDGAAMREHLCNGRGWLIEPDYQYIDPFGNGYRYFASIEDGIRALEEIASNRPDREERLDKAQAYVNSRTWQNAGNILVKILDEIIQEHNGETETETESAATAEIEYAK